MIIIDMMSSNTQTHESLDYDLVMKLFLSKVKISIIFDYLCFTEELSQLLPSFHLVLILSKSSHIQELSLDDCQQRLLDATIDHKLMDKYPVSLKYRQLFAKQLIQLLERHDLSVCEMLSISNAALITDTPLINDYNLNYLSYVLTDGQIVSLQESDNLVIDGTTGLRSWSAARHLAAFIECNKHYVHNKYVLELGSGIGLTGVCILKTCSPDVLAFSDHHSVVLRVLRNNIDTNNVGLNSVVHNIDWNDMKSVDNYLGDNDPDVIIAADVVFDPKVTVHLCQVLNKLLVDCNKARVCYICCTHRNDETIEHFCRLITDEYKLHLQEVYFENSAKDLKSFCFDSLDVNTSIFKIYSDK